MSSSLTITCARTPRGRLVNCACGRCLQLSSKPGDEAWATWNGSQPERKTSKRMCAEAPSEACVPGRRHRQSGARRKGHAVACAEDENVCTRMPSSGFLARSRSSLASRCITAAERGLLSTLHMLAPEWPLMPLPSCASSCRGRHCCGLGRFPQGCAGESFTFKVTQNTFWLHTKADCTPLPHTSARGPP